MTWPQKATMMTNRPIRYAFTFWQFWLTSASILGAGLLTGFGFALLAVQYRWL